MSGPVEDRIDIRRHVQPVRPHEVADPLSRPEPTAVVRSRVVRARARQAARYAGTPWRLNADVPGPQLSDLWPLSPEGASLVDSAVCDGSLTRRGAVRVHRLAWTVSDLRGLAAERAPGTEEVDVALRLRLGHDLPSAVVSGVAG